MPTLADIQRKLRAAVVDGETAAIVPLLAGGRDPRSRLAVHLRHYETSLVQALLGKFPAVCWLMGTSFVRDAALAFVHAHPPAAPCIAEYGKDFPAFMANRPEADRAPYLRWFAELEWHLGQVSIAIEFDPLEIDCLNGIGADQLVDVILHTQPGLRYLAAPWPVDELMRIFMDDAAPERHQFDPRDVWLELRGARGRLAINALDAASFAFRQAIAAGSAIGTAAEQAMEVDEGFLPGAALSALFCDGLVIGRIAPQARLQR